MLPNDTAQVMRRRRVASVKRRYSAFSAETRCLVAVFTRAVGFGELRFRVADFPDPRGWKPSGLSTSSLVDSSFSRQELGDDLVQISRRHRQHDVSRPCASYR